MSFADLILRRPLWEQVAQQLQLPLFEGAQAPSLYDNVAELMHGKGARFPQEAQKQVEQTAERMKGLIEGAGNRSRVLGALVSVLLPTSFAISGEWNGVQVAVVPDHLAPSANKDHRLLFAAFQRVPLSLGLEMVREDALFQAARTLTQAQDIELGILPLDERAVIRGLEEDATRLVLTQPKVTDALLKFFELEGKWLINDRGALITVTIPTAGLGKETLCTLLDRLVQVVTALA